MSAEFPETIAERVNLEFEQEIPDWSKYTLDEVQRAYAGLIGWRKNERRRTKKNQSEWNLNGERIRAIQKVLAGKWAERGKEPLLEKILAMTANCENPDRINNYDDLLLNELKAAYENTKSID